MCASRRKARLPHQPPPPRFARRPREGWPSEILRLPLGRRSSPLGPHSPTGGTMCKSKQLRRIWRGLGIVAAPAGRKARLHASRYVVMLPLRAPRR